MNYELTDQPINITETEIDTNFAGVDGNGAVIDTTPIYNAILDAPDKVWKRNEVHC